MLNAASVEDDVVLSPAHREVIRRGGQIDIPPPYRLWIEGSFLRIEILDSVSLPPLNYLLKVQEETRRLYGSLFTLVLVGEHVSTPPVECRRRLAEWTRIHGTDTVAIVSASNPLFLGIIRLVMRAMDLVRHNSRPTAFFATESEGRHWLDERRRMAQASAP